MFQLDSDVPAWFFDSYFFFPAHKARCGPRKDFLPATPPVFRELVLSCSGFRFSPERRHSVAALEDELLSVSQVLVIRIHRCWLRSTVRKVITRQVAFHQELHTLRVLGEEVLKKPEFDVTVEVAEQREKLPVPSNGFLPLAHSC